MLALFYRTRSRYFLLFIIIASVFAQTACTSSQNKRPVYDESNVYDPNKQLNPDDLATSQDYLKSAAQQPAELKDDYLLRVAYQFIINNNQQSALKILNEINNEALPYYLKQRFAILQGYTLVGLNQLDKSAAVLNQDYVFSSEFKQYNYLTETWLLEARAHLAEKLNATESAIIYYHQLNILLPSDKLYQNQMSLFNYLQHQPIEKLEELRLLNDNESVSYWAELGTYYVNYANKDKSTWQGLVDKWYASNSIRLNIDQQFINEIKEGPTRLVKSENTINRVMMILPNDPRYKSVADAIKSGYTDAAKYYHPTLQIQYYDYSSQLVNIESLVANSQTDLAIGPLGKMAVNALTNNQKVFNKPIILLGDSSQPNLTNAIQFALAPEDEINAMLDLFAHKNIKNIAVVYPNDNKGNRLYNHLRKQSINSNLEINDNISVELESYDAASVSSRIASHYNQYQNSSAVIFLTSSEIAGDININLQDTAPALTKIATSEISSGQANPNQEIELDFGSALNGIIFPDMPWMMGNIPTIPRNLQNNFAAEYTALDRFYAYGIDLFLVTQAISQNKTLSEESIKGSTADLSFNLNGKIVRKLYWYQFQNDQPAPYF